MKSVISDTTAGTEIASSTVGEEESEVRIEKADSFVFPIPKIVEHLPPQFENELE